MRGTLARAGAVRFSKTARFDRPRVHEREAARNRRRAGRSPAPRVVDRRLPDHLPEGGAEGAEAAEADLEADLRHRQLGLPQELLGALDPAPAQVLVRSLAEGPLEAAAEVGGGRVGRAGE